MADGGGGPPNMGGGSCGMEFLALADLSFKIWLMGRAPFIGEVSRTSAFCEGACRTSA